MTTYAVLELDSLAGITAVHGVMQEESARVMIARASLAPGMSIVALPVPDWGYRFNPDRGSRMPPGITATVRAHSTSGVTLGRREHDDADAADVTVRRLSLALRNSPTPCAELLDMVLAGEVSARDATATLDGHGLNINSDLERLALDQLRCLCNAQPLKGNPS